MIKSDDNPSKSLVLEKIKRRMSRELDCPQSETKFRYLICTTPRTGSNFLCSILRASGVAGHPLEYMNGNYLMANYNFAPVGNTRYDYLREMEGRRTTPNGVFGIKTMYFQLVAFFNKQDKPTLEFLKRQNLLIYLYRKNKLEQAVSWFLANKTNVYTSIEEGEYSPIIFDGPTMVACLNELVREDSLWQKALKRYELPHVKICYEDLIKHPEREVSKIYKFFGVEGYSKVDENEIEKKLQHPQYGDLLSQFKSFLSYS